MSSKVERALYGPSLSEVLIGAALSVVIGALIGLALLVTKPVLKVSEIPKDAPSGQIYFIDGAHLPARMADIDAKEKKLLAGQSVSFDESELNLMFEPSAPQAEGSKGAGKPDPKAPAPAAAPSGFLTLGKLSFRLHDNLLQLAAPLTVSALGFSTDVIVQVNGDFQKSDGVYHFVPSSILVGSCPLEHLPVIPGLLVQKVEAGMKFPPELEDAWAKLSLVAVQGTTLKLVAR